MQSHYFTLLHVIILKINALIFSFSVHIGRLHTLLVSSKFLYSVCCVVQSDNTDIFCLSESCFAELRDEDNPAFVR